MESKFIQDDDFNFEEDDNSLTKLNQTFQIKEKKKLKTYIEKGINTETSVKDSNSIFLKGTPMQAPKPSKNVFPSMNIKSNNTVNKNMQFSPLSKMSNNNSVQSNPSGNPLLKLKQKKLNQTNILNNFGINISGKKTSGLQKKMEFSNPGSNKFKKNLINNEKNFENPELFKNEIEKNNELPFINTIPTVKNIISNATTFNNQPFSISNIGAITTNDLHEQKTEHMNNPYVSTMHYDVKSTTSPSPSSYFTTSIPIVNNTINDTNTVTFGFGVSPTDETFEMNENDTFNKSNKED